MTRPAAIDQERAQLDSMIRLLGLDIEGEPVKQECPDFLVQLRDGRRIGIELVRALNERIASGRGSRARLKRGVRAGLATVGLNAWVNVRLHANVAAMLNEDAAALNREVSAIVELARSTVAAGMEERWYNFEWIDRSYERVMRRRRTRQRDMGDLDGTGIEHVDAVGVHPYREPFATWSLSGNAQRPNIVQDAICGKVDDLAVYRGCGTDEIWLLVIGSAGTGGEMFVDDVEEVVFESPYDQTIFLELFEGRCIRLQTSHAANTAT